MQLSGLIFILFLLIPFKSLSQEGRLFMGPTIGSETLYSIIPPKISYIYADTSGSYRPYGGLEGSFWMFFSFWYSVSATAGIQKDNITLETSLGYFRFPANQYAEGNVSHFTVNPKLGWQISDIWGLPGIWLKAGPSFVFSKNYANDRGEAIADILKIGNIRLNVELLVKLPRINTSYGAVWPWEKEVLYPWDLGPGFENTLSATVMSNDSPLLKDSVIHILKEIARRHSLEYNEFDYNNTSRNRMSFFGKANHYYTFEILENNNRITFRFIHNVTVGKVAEYSAPQKELMQELSNLFKERIEAIELKRTR
jgi:hypothetical protein